MKVNNYDFSGWATRNDLRCSDGRTIRDNAFKDCDGKTVPIVWQHQHDSPENILGHALLKNVPGKGVYAYGKFNDTEMGQTAKELVTHRDIKNLSIYANKLQQKGKDVFHGVIREVSLVLSGANPGALIDFPTLEHSGEEVPDEAIIYTDKEISLKHADEFEEEKEKEENPNVKKTEEVKKEKKENEMAGENDKTVKDVFDSLTEEQKSVVYFLIGKALEEKEGEIEDMKHNVFDSDDDFTGNALSHAEMEEIIADGKKYGSLKESFLAHAAEYGIDQIDWLFPEARSINPETGAPGFVKRNPDEWVSVVMNGVHNTPFSRVKMMFADLREDDARAKGYATKGKLKKEEVFGLIKRQITPTTVYKKQKLDRDDVIDITDFDVIAWIKGEMRMMLDEELARAYLFGDGRTNLDEDKISEANIIPITKDADFYSIKKTVTPDTGEALGHAIIRTAVKGLDDYEGSGNTIFFTKQTYISDMLLMEDDLGHRLYKDINEIALAMNVKKIVAVPGAVVPADIYGVIVDLKDYNVGADKGGAVNMFDDFDIDYNQQKYLIETRCSAGLIRPFSAVVLKTA